MNDNYNNTIIDVGLLLLLPVLLFIYFFYYYYYYDDNEEEEEEKEIENIEEEKECNTCKESKEFVYIILHIYTHKCQYMFNCFCYIHTSFYIYIIVLSLF